MDIKIRPAIIGDLKKIQDLNLRLFVKESEEYDDTLDCNWPFSQEGAEYFGKRIREDDGCLFVATINDGLVAYLTGGFPEPETFRVLPKMAELENMFVLDEYREQGIGTRLVAAFTDWCQKNGAGRLKVMASAQNTEGIGFYKKHGFSDYNLILERDL